MSDEAELEAAVAFVSADSGDNSVPVPAEQSGDGSSVVESPLHSALTDYDNQLIAELVANIRPAAEILRTYGLTQADLVAKARSPEWASRYRQISSEWNSDKNAKERVRAKAMFLLEDALVPLSKMVKTGNPAHRLGAVDRLIEISTVAVVPKDNGDVGEKTTITINYGGPAPVTVTQETAHERTVATIAADPTRNAK